MSQNMTVRRLMEYEFPLLLTESLQQSRVMNWIYFYFKHDETNI